MQPNPIQWSIPDSVKGRKSAKNSLSPSDLLVSGGYILAVLADQTIQIRSFKTREILQDIPAQGFHSNLTLSRNADARSLRNHNTCRFSKFSVATFAVRF